MRRSLYTLLALLADALQRVFVRHGALYRILLAAPLADLRWRVGAWRAWLAFRRAYRRVPAYRRFVDERGGVPRLRRRDGLPDLSVVPETDKSSYVRRYPHAERCVGGAIPGSGVVVDESSGSSGAPTSWIRGPEERATTRHMLQMAYRHALGDGSFFILNAFALGAWATGLNVTMSLSDVSIMKSTGPDVDKIVNTMREFGPGHEYVVMGYPPFLKTLADTGVPWDEYRVRAVFGGEAMSESLRDYLLERFVEVLGSYGASDLEINLATESPFTVGLRRALRESGALRERLTDTSRGVLPMVFQYNPLAYHLETNGDGELIVTLNRPTNLAPKIRYNIHDLGHVARFGEVAGILREAGLGSLLEETDPVHLPVLFLYGRSDASVDYHGANVTPESIREILFSLPDLAPALESFRLIAGEDAGRNPTLEVALELVEGADPGRIDPVPVADRLFDRLTEVNGDFRNAYRNTAAAEHLPTVSVHTRGRGPFAGGERIKKSYVDSGPCYDPL